VIERDKNPREVCFEKFSRVIRQLDECVQLVLWGCLVSCRAAILAATCGGGYRNLPYIWGLGNNFMSFLDSPFFQPGLFFAQDKSFDQHNDPNPDQDEGTNQGPLDVGPLDDPDSYWDGAEESQAVVKSFRKGLLF